MRPADRTCKQTFALAVVVALLLAQPAYAGARAALRRNAPFTVSSLGTPFGVQLRVEGTYTVNDHYVEVNVERAFIYVSEHCPYQGQRFIRTLSVGLATKTPQGRWEIENRSLPVFVEHLMSPRDEYRLADLHFQIPRNEGADLTNRWLIVETEETAPDLPGDAGNQKGYAYAHSRRDIFADSAAAQP